MNWRVTWARLVGEVLGFREASPRVLQTGKGDLSEPVGVGRSMRQRVADDHSESWLKRCDFGRLLVVGKAVLHVVDGHAALSTLETDVWHNGYALVCAVPSFEEEDRCPVVGGVF